MANICWCGEQAKVTDCGFNVCREHSKKFHDNGRINFFCDHCAGNAEQYGVKVTENY